LQKSFDTLTPLATQQVKKVALNALFLQRRMGGIETYVRELVPALLALPQAPALEIFVTPSGREALQDEPWVGDVELVTPPIARLPMTKAISELTLVGALADRRRADVVHSVAMIGPVRSRASSVVTIPDVTWWRDPSTVPSATRLMWRAFVPLGARHARRVIVLSHVAAREVSEDLGIPPTRIDVVPLGAGTSSENGAGGRDIRAAWQLGGGPVLLAVSGLAPHKNVGVAIDAMTTILERRPDAILVVPGNPTRHGRELIDRAESRGVAAAVRFPGWVDQGDLEALYRIAACLLFPSMREGFGLPVLEAMARGLPVISARASAMPEVAGDAALYFDPLSSDDLARNVDRLLGEHELAARLRDAGRQRARTFTWERAAEQTLAVYERALRGD
jgi:glycosyltransferase involved in cell wall biosynthesis